MAHELYTLEDGSYSMLRSEDSEVSWHGLETIIPADSPFDTWANHPVFDWKIKRGLVRYNVDREGTQLTSEDNHVLFRSDNNKLLSIVSKDYCVVQPKQVLEFFRDVCEANHLTMDTAGIIRNGQKFWALARTGHDLNVGNRDVVKQYVLLASSSDSSMATTAKHTSLRVVCSNTLHQNLGNGEAAIKVRHSTEFNPDVVKINLGLMEAEFSEFGAYAQEMSQFHLSVTDAQRWLAELFSGKIGLSDEDVADITNRSRVFKSVWESYTKAPGAEPTLWGAVNAVTHNVDWVKGRSLDTRFDSAQFGAGASLKQAAWDKAAVIISAARKASSAVTSLVTS